MNSMLQQLSEEIARNPSSTAYGPLADALRQQGQLDAARLIALRGLERHPYDPDAHDALARVYADAGDSDRARDEWEMALQLDAGHVPARKGLGYLAFRLGDVHRAAEWLGSALEKAPDDEGLQSAYRRVCESIGGPVRALDRWGWSDDVTEPFGHAVVRDANGAGDGDRAVRHGAEPDSPAAFRATLLLDRDGLLVRAYGAPSVPDETDAMAAHGAAVFAEATRAMDHLGLGRCESLLVEAATAVCAVAVSDERLVLVTAAGLTPVGLVRSQLERAVHQVHLPEGGGR